MQPKPFTLFHRYDGGADYGESLQLGHEAMRRLGAYEGPLNRNAIIDIVIRYGGSGGLASRLGYERGTPGFKAAQRAIERHVSGVTPRKGIWRDRYERLRQPDIKGGIFDIIVCGRLKVSEDTRDRCIMEMADARRVLTPFDPLEEWYANLPMTPDIERLDSLTVAYRP